ncbi:MAG TPA: hypothetical protein VLL49_01560 [Anaerolineales bacterium]|nr:hypothetical protein [Anaerolineales bacterium]
MKKALTILESWRSTCRAVMVGIGVFSPLVEPAAKAFRVIDGAGKGRRAFCTMMDEK